MKQQLTRHCLVAYGSLKFSKYTFKGMWLLNGSPSIHANNLELKLTSCNNCLIFGSCLSANILSY